MCQQYVFFPLINALSGHEGNANASTLMQSAGEGVVDQHPGVNRVLGFIRPPPPSDSCDLSLRNNEQSEWRSAVNELKGC